MSTTYSAVQVQIKSIPKKSPTPKDTFSVKKNVKIGPLKTGDILIEPEYLSVDPYQLFQLSQWSKLKPPCPLSNSFAKVIDSKDGTVKKGDYIYGTFPWASPAIINMKTTPFTKYPPKVKNVKTKHDDNDEDGKDADGDDGDDDEPEYMDFSKVTRRQFMGVLGMPSQTAYFGLIDRAQIKKGETVVISGAAGAVGNVAGQIAKAIYGCTVIGFAGSKKKCDWLKKDLGFDGALNYKDYKDKAALQKALKQALGTKKIDIYYDNVGGIITESMWDLLGFRSRVIICGQISHYTKDKKALSYNHLSDLIYREISVYGIMVYHHLTDFPLFYKDMIKWVLNGKIKGRDTIVKGMENIGNAFCGLFDGKNIGKMVVQCFE